MNKDLYPASEHHLIDQLHSLFSRWRKAVDAAGLPGLSGDLLVTDGLYPRYTMQKIPLLFIGRETLEMEGEDYIDVLFSAYKEQRVAGTSLNVYPAAGLINYYKGDKLVLVNLSETPYDNYADLVIHEKIGEVFSQI